MSRSFFTVLLVTALLVLAPLAFVGCAGSDEATPEATPTAGASTAEPSLADTWRGVLASPGGELPFRLNIKEGTEGLSATAVTGEESLPFSSVERQGNQVILRFAWYDSELTAQLSEDGTTLSGEWRKTIPDGHSRLPFSAQRGDERRFSSLEEAGLEGGVPGVLDSVEGLWAVEFTDDSGSENARGEFRQNGKTVEGTFLTPTGDYRFLEGSYEEGLLRLSTFDGAHAFLFHARSREDGSLEGDFWSRDTYHATWTGCRVESAEEAPVPDAWSLAGLTNDEGRLNFEFPDLDGNPVSLSDERFEDKVVLVNIFGSWCPNCNDEAPLLAKWDREFRDQGLEILGLAYEFRGHPEKDRVVVEHFARRYGLEYPILLAGISDKAAAGETLPDLSSVVAFPTSIFIGRDGKVRRIHSGFSGPGTGEHYHRLVAEFESLLTELLAESAG